MKTFKAIKEKEIVYHLMTINKHSPDNRRFLFKRIKNLKNKSLVAYYQAARTYGELNLSAAIRDHIFEKFIS
jgi:hypothetical protein